MTLIVEDEGSQLSDEKTFVEESEQNGASDVKELPFSLSDQDTKAIVKARRKLEESVVQWYRILLNSVCFS